MCAIEESVQDEQSSQTASLPNMDISQPPSNTSPSISQKGSFYPKCASQSASIKEPDSVNESVNSRLTAPPQTSPSRSQSASISSDCTLSTDKMADDEALSSPQEISLQHVEPSSQTAQNSSTSPQTSVDVGNIRESSQRPQVDLPLAVSRLQCDRHIAGVHIPGFVRPRSTTITFDRSHPFPVSTPAARASESGTLPGGGFAAVDALGRVHETPPPYVEVELHRTMPDIYFRSPHPSEPPPPYSITGENPMSRVLQENCQLDTDAYTSRRNNPVRKGNCYQRTVCFFATGLICVVIAPFLFLLFKN